MRRISNRDTIFSSRIRGLSLFEVPPEHLPRGSGDECLRVGRLGRRIDEAPEEDRIILISGSSDPIGVFYLGVLRDSV